MSWLKWIGIGIALVVVLTVGIVAAGGFLSSDQRAAEPMSMTIGDHTITVDGEYKTMTQESLADGMKIVVDNHVIAATPGELTVDGKTQDLDPGQDVEIVVKENGGLDTKLVSSDAGSQ